MQTTVDGIVLSSKKIEGNRILTILTGESGLVSAFANRAGSVRSRIAASTEVLSYSRFVLFSYRGRTVVDKADSNRIFFGIRKDYVSLCLASYFAQLSAELLAVDEPAHEPLRLLLNCLHYLEEGNRDRRLLKGLYELRLLTLTGFMPALVSCRFCSKYESEAMYFFPQEGDIVCSDCFGENQPEGGVKLSMGALSAMRHIIYSPVERLFSFALADGAQDELHRVCEGYLLCKAERRFSALDLYKQSS